MNKIFFDSWESVFRTAIITVLAYVILIIMLRVSGKRTLSKMNAFDLIVTIALGSTLATVMLSKDVALIDGALAFFLLIFLQFAITWLSVRNQKVNRLVKSTPALLYYKGSMLDGTLRKERVTPDEIFAVVRENGYSSMDDVDAVVLETDGSLTAIAKVKNLESEVMRNINAGKNSDSRPDGSS